MFLHNSKKNKGRKNASLTKFRYSVFNPSNLGNTEPRLSRGEMIFLSIYSVHFWSYDIPPQMCPSWIAVFSFHFEQLQ